MPETPQQTTPSGAGIRVGFIGLGSQGAPMARRIVESGYPTTLWGRRAATLDPFAATGARTAHSPADLARTSDLVCLCVVGDADVSEVVTGPDGVLAGLAPGGIIAVHSTVHPDTCRRLDQEARRQDVSVIDAPVSGGGQAAAERRLLVMAGGPEAVVEACRPVFDTYADPVVHLGPTGAGQIAKLLNNLLFAANLATAKSTVDLGEVLGIGVSRLGEVRTQGTAASDAVNRVVLLGGVLDLVATYGGELLRKDVGLIAGVAATAGIPTGIALTAADAALDMLDHPRR